MRSFELLVTFIFILMSVAFLTLGERKLLGYSQQRKAPNKVGILGLLQPISDAIKLFSKNSILPSKSLSTTSMSGPLVALSLGLSLWSASPLTFSQSNFSLGILLFSLISALTVYFFSLTGWGSCSWYALLGCYRASAQSISYEISLALIILTLVFSLKTFNLAHLISANFFILLPCFPLFLLWSISALAETNRTPFDFAEGESELVSGFNTEYAGNTFALLFLAEYSSIIFISLLTCVFFMPTNLLLEKTMLIVFWMSWVRAASPRSRYDKLMMLAWKILLPLTLSLFSIFIMLSAA